MSAIHQSRHQARPLRIALRLAGFFCLWLAIAGADTSDLLVGIATAVAATWASLRLLPPGASRIRPIAMIRLVSNFLWQSVRAGLDVARRALDPRLPVRPGFLLFPSRLAPGPARSMFCVMESLLPGTLPAGSDESDALVLHCLDIDQPVLAQTDADEALFMEALGLERSP
jgi:multicomponent Na+:H+ antiporter subunit E